MTQFHGLAAMRPGARLETYDFAPAPLGPFDVEIEVSHCGICHSDVHLIDDDWGLGGFPLVPGHEVVGVATALGSAVDFLTTGQRVGVGWQCGSCGHCDACVEGNENLCGASRATCSGRPGGFADRIRVDGRFAFPIPSGLDSAAAAPLMCGGATVFAPLARHARPTHRVGVVGIGGLGHLAIRFAATMGCGVTAFSSSPGKEVEARRLGADEFCPSGDRDALAAQRGRFDVIVSTVFAPLDWTRFTMALRPGGTLVLVGALSEPLTIPAHVLLSNRAIAGSAIGSRTEIRRMLAFAERAEIGAIVETFAMADANAAVARVRSNDVRFRAVLAA